LFNILPIKQVDFGSALAVANEEGIFNGHGMLSTGRNFDNAHYWIYTKLDFYIDWIKKTIAEN
jgi:hypothetical protein